MTPIKNNEAQIYPKIKTEQDKNNRDSASDSNATERFY